MSYAHLQRTLTIVAALCLLSSSGSALQQSPTAATPGTVLSAAVEELAGALVAAGSEDERESLLAASPELLTADLRRSLSARGEKLRADGDYARALASYRAALSVARKLDDAEGVAQTLANLGGVYRVQGDYAKAMESYDESVKRWEALGRPAGMARTLTSIGVLRYFQGEYDASLAANQAALKLLEGLDDKDAAAVALNGIGAVHRERGEYDLALDFYQRSLRVAEEQGNKLRIGTALNNIGILYTSWGDYARALEYYQRSHDLRAALGDKLGMSISMLNMGDIHQLQGNYNLSLDYFQKSLVLREALNDKEGIGNVLNALGEGYRRVGRYDLALESLRRSLSLREALGNKPRIARTLHNLGNVLLSQGDASSARQFYERALALEEGAGDRERSVDTMNMLGVAYETQGASEKAVETAARAASLARRIGYLGGLWPARAVAGRAHRALKQTDEARAALDEAIDAIESVRARAAGGEQEGQYFFADKISPYAEMVALFVSQNRHEEALQYAERARGRVLLDVLRAGRSKIDKSLTPVERERERTLRRELSALNAQAQREAAQARPSAARLADLNARLDRARLDLDAYTNALYALHPELRLQRGEAPRASLTQLNEQLGRPDTALVEYVVGDEQTFLFVLNGAGRAVAPALKVYTLNVKRRELLDRVGRFRRQLAERDLLFGGAARALYDLLLAPARAQLQEKTALVIVPDDALWELPFQALQSPSGRYVLEDQAVSYTPSLSVARAVILRRRGRPLKPSSVPNLLAFGNPLLGGGAVRAEPVGMMSGGAGALPEAERQVRTLGQLYGEAHSRVYTGAEAREDRFKAEAGRYRILHLAAHGVLNDASPMYSHILLSQGATDAAEDGLLETWELMNLDLNADMVVLSACETARGSVRPGEGMVGLSWGFFVAGSPTTLVTQWKVDSSATTELMLGFYRHLKADARGPEASHSPPPSKAAALREASLKLISSERYAHPFYWAGFVLIGDSYQ
ncbi:MAG TPA: tetratricopeptide repeat protein [Pyrinomonadaceae bacterium]